VMGALIGLVFGGLVLAYEKLFRRVVPDARLFPLILSLAAVIFSLAHYLDISARRWRIGFWADLLVAAASLPVVAILGRRAASRSA
jgi:hypothetical protein